MNTHDHVTKWIRLVLAAAMAVAVGLAITPSGSQAALEYDPSANGGAAPIGELTRFEIDGDRVPGVKSNTGVTLAPGVNADWESTPYGPQPPTSNPATPAPAGIGSSGLLPLLYAEIKADDYPIVLQSPNPAYNVPGLPNNTQQFCTGGKEDGWVGGRKVQDVNVDNPLYTVGGLQALECSSVLDKGNLLSAFAAYETVAVPNDYGNPDAGSQNHVIIYGGWERGEVPGELNFYIPIADAVPGNSAGDRLIAFDYDSSAPASYRILSWNGSSWVVTQSGTAAINGDTFAAAVGFAAGGSFTPGNGAKPSFGEFALDLTASNILPSDSSSCVQLSTAGFVFTETGNSATAQLKDYVGAPKIPISNCGPMSVTKAGPAGVTNSPNFDFRVEQQDSSPIFATAPVTTPSSTTTQYNDQFELGDKVTLNHVIAQPDYMAFEEPVAISGGAPAPLPTGWEMITVDCTYIDGFTSGYPVVTERLYLNTAGRLTDDNGDLKVFQVHSTAFNTLTGHAGFVPNCVITNDAAGIVIAKETLPDGATTEFPFNISGGGASQDTTLADGESAFYPFDAGTSVTITEGAAAGSPSWNLSDIVCRNEDGSEIDTSAGETATSVALPVGAVDNTITCTFVNTQNGTVTVDKTGLPGDATQAFDFTVGATPVGPLTIPGPSQSVEVTPGTYTVTELEPPVDADWVLTDITCDNEANENLTGQSVDVLVAPGQNVNCTFTNKQRGPVTITKDAVLLDPAPVAGTIDEFDVRYTVTAESASYIDENIVVTDTFAFPGALTVVSGPTVSGAVSSAGWNGVANTELYSGTIPAQGTLTWTIDVRVQLDLASLTADRDCNAAGSGAWNDVQVAVDGVTVDEDDACIPFGDPTITIDKNVVGGVTVNPDQTMSVTYSIDVANVGDGPGSYDLADTFGFPGWVTVGSVTVANTAPGGIAVEDGTFDGAGNDAITSATTGIGAGATHTYTITVTFTAAPTATEIGADCGPGTGHGLFNLGTVTTSTGDVSDDACIDIPRGRIIVTKATFGGTGTFGFSSSVPGALIDGGSITTATDDGAASGNTLSAYVTPGSYTVTEAAQAGWTQIATPCGDTAPAVVTDGASVSCDFQNGKQAQITVQKVADPAGTFEFTLAPAPGDVQNVDSGSEHTWTGLDAGDFTLTETVVSPWQLVDAACDGVAYANGDAIAVDWGDDITCVFTNEALAEIIVEKQTLPDGATQAFTFSPSYGDNFDLADGGTASSGLIVAGEYVITELATSGWDFISVDCVVTSSIAEPDNGSTFVPSGNSATVTLEPGDTVTCTYANTQRGQIVVNKTIADGTAVGAALLQTFDFDVDGTSAVGGVVTDESVTLDGNGDDADGTSSTASYEVRPGAYSVSETVPADWQLDGVVCTDAQDPAALTVEPGATVECTFTNSPDPADVTIDKTVVNVAGDFAWSFDFTIAPAPAGQDATQPATGVGPDTVQIGWTDLIPGQEYTITETVPANWTQSGLVCVGADDGDATDNSVTFTATPGLALSCSVTNTPVNPTIVVNKTTVGGVGIFDFTITPENADDDLIAFSIETLAADTPVASATYDLVSGLSYAVDELDPGTAWAEGTLDCGTFGTGAGGAAASVTVLPGDVVECSISNSALGNITVIKDTVGADGTFGFTLDGDAFEITTLAGSGNADFQNLQPGIYTIVETDPTANFDGTGLSCTSSNGDTETVDLATLTATVGLSNGETVVCTYTNTERAHIVVDKVTNPSGDTTPFTFTETWTPVTGGSFQLADGDAPADSGPIASNTAYTVLEAPQPGWVVTGFVCTGGTNDVVYDVDANDADGASATINPAPGETILCEVTNNLRGPVTITKVANPGSVSRSGETYTVVYDLTVETESYIDESFTLTDTPGFAAGVDITSAVYRDADDNIVVLPLNGTISPGEVLVYTATFEFTIDGGVSLALRDCAGIGTATFNSATVTYDVDQTNESNDCVELPDPAITQTKTAVTDPAQPVYLGGNAYTVAYEIEVINAGEGPGSYTLVEAPDFGDGITITAISATSTDGVVDPGFALGSLTLASDVDLPAGQSDTYVVTVALTIDGAATLDARNCTQEPGSGAYNAVSITVNGVPGSPADACVELPDPLITIVKTAGDGQPVLVGDNVYTAEYTITVDNIGDGPGAYDLSDTPDFGAGATVTNIAVSGNGVTIDEATAGPVTIITGETIDPDEAAHVYTVTVTFEVDGAMTTDARTCSGEPGSGAFNGGEVTYNGGQTAQDDDCVDIPEPDVSIDKTLDAGNPLTRNVDGTWTLGYLLTATNAADAGPAQYDLDDTFTFTGGVTVDGVTVEIVESSAVAGDLIAGFDGAAQPSIVDGVQINAGETHTYRVIVDLSIVPNQGTNGDCTTEGGLFNEMSLSVRGDEPLTDTACDSFSILTLVKVLDNGDGGTAVLGDFTLTAAGAAATISGTSPVVSAVPAGSYELSETNIDGYATDGYVCDAEHDATSVQVADGASVTCTITNDDRPVDLQLTKDDGGFEAVAGGDPIPYTITVRNVGTRDADLGEPITVTDQLPAPLAWKTFPANCSQVGQTLTCGIDPALMTAGGAAVVINTTVTVGPGVPSGTYVNKAWVTTEDDPVCEGEGCTPPPCPAAENNNVDCEDTPVTRTGAIRITKTDNVASGERVQPGDTFTYALVVTNTGVSTILPGTHVADDLPAQLEFVSAVGGAGWTCNNSDPVDCDYAPALAPGASAPAITVTVAVADDATGENIVNVAVVLGAVDRDCPSATGRLSESFTPACNQVTDDDDETTPLTANADLAIVKTASVAQVGAGGGFTWTLDITNNGPATAVNVVIGDLVPSSVTVTGVASSDFACGRTGNDVECTVGSLAVGASGTVSITVTVPVSAVSGNVTNVGTVESDTPDPDLTNNSDEATVTIVAQQAVTTLPPVTLPRTGSDATQDIVRIATLFLLLGGAVILITRRRRDEGFVTD